MTAGFAFPILIGARVVVMVEFFAEEAMEPDVKLLDAMETMGYFLGRMNVITQG